MVNWVSNVFPGILGRVCDRPCEPACRRGRVEEDPVAICRLKRVAADNRDDILPLLPSAPKEKNGKRIALIGGGPASLTVARDLSVLGYELDLYDNANRAGGFIRSQIPSFRLPEEVLNTEVNYILDMGGITTHFNTYVSSLQEIIDKKYDAVFVGTGAQTGKRVLVLGGGNTAMDCCRTARRLGGDQVKVVVRSPQADMKASDWEIEDALKEDIPILDNHVPLEFVVEKGKLTGMRFEKVQHSYDDEGRRTLVPSDEDPVYQHNHNEQFTG